MRLNPNNGNPASSLLKAVSQIRLEEIFAENSDEPYAHEIAEAIKLKIAKGATIETTKQLRDIIADVLKFVPQNQRKEEVKKTCQRVFQALRIAVNDEFGVLEKFLDELPYSLSSGGRVAILTFHSGEDRRVKKSFQQFFNLGLYNEIAPDPIRPTAEECNSNPRARSAKLRWAVKA